ncbi:MAG: hypothetical protein RLZZ253_1478 [Verrucomicrobiota bacterium]|jgi:hypothetical protein
MMRFFFGADRLRVHSFHAQKRGETDQRSPFFWGKSALGTLFWTGWNGGLRLGRSGDGRVAFPALYSP